MPNTFTKIASVTVGGAGAASMDFTSIPATYTDLCVKVSARDLQPGVTDNIQIQFNGSSANLSSKVIEGNGSSASSYSDTQIYGRSVGAGATANTFGSTEFYITNYAGSTNKSVSVDSVSETNATTAYATLTAGLWSNTAVITSISIKPTAAVNLVQYSTATLYGIKSS